MTLLKNVFGALCRSPGFQELLVPLVRTYHWGTYRYIFIHSWHFPQNHSYICLENVKRCSLRQSTAGFNLSKALGTPILNLGTNLGMIVFWLAARHSRQIPSDYCHIKYAASQTASFACAALGLCRAITVTRDNKLKQDRVVPWYYLGPVYTALLGPVRGNSGILLVSVWVISHLISLQLERQCCVPSISPLQFEVEVIEWWDICSENIHVNG